MPQKKGWLTLVPIESPRRVKVHAGKRALKNMADQAIRHDLLKGLIELITNSDESYARLESDGIQDDRSYRVGSRSTPKKRSRPLSESLIGRKG